MPLFSVIVPIFKVEKYLNQCIDSILGQSYSDFELILVDDGSPDRCPEICDSYAANDSRIRVLHKENGGLVSARKAGAKISTGKYIVCVDGDDWVRNDYIEIFAKAIKEFETDIVICGYNNAYPKKNKPNKIRFPSGFYSRSDIVEHIFPTLIQSNVASYFPPSLWAKAFRKELYQNAQYLVDDRVKIGEDGACTIPCLYHAQSIYITHEHSYFYRQNPDAMTKDRHAFAWHGPELIYQHLKSQIGIDENDFQIQIARKTVHDLFQVVVSQFYRKERYASIIDDIKKHLKSPIYQTALLESSFLGVKARCMHFALKHQFFFLLLLYSKIL